MFVSILQLMGFPPGKPVHSRAERSAAPEVTRSRINHVQNQGRLCPRSNRRIKTARRSPSESATAKQKRLPRQSQLAAKPAKAAKPAMAANLSRQRSQKAVPRPCASQRCAKSSRKKSSAVSRRRSARLKRQTANARRRAKRLSTRSQGRKQVTIVKLREAPKRDCAKTTAKPAVKAAAPAAQ